MRFMGTVKIELADGTTEKFKDQSTPYRDDPNNDFIWWTHTFEKEWDDTLVVTRHVTRIDQYHGGGRPLKYVMNYEAEHVSEYLYEVARYSPGSWRTAKRKTP